MIDWRGGRGRGRGDGDRRFVALPAFPLRNFTGRDLYVRNDGSIRTPADLKGMKIRIQSSKVLEEEMRTLGALPQVMAFSEVYQALQTGVVDGTELEASHL